MGQKAVNDDLQYEEEEDINCDMLENLVTHIPAIQIMFVRYLIHKIKYLSCELCYNLACVSLQYLVTHGIEKRAQNIFLFK